MESLDFRVEAKMSVEEIAYAVREACLSEKLESVSLCAYINITTKEDNKFTIRLSPRGFEVVGHEHDNVDLEKSSSIKEAHETVYALLGNISPGYSADFSNALSSKLSALADSTHKQE